MTRPPTSANSPAAGTDTIISIRDAHVAYRTGRGRRASALHALSGVSLDLPTGHVLGVAGESGCGKSTLARAVVGLQPLDSGVVMLDGRALEPSRSRSDQRAIQMVFQDPASSLNPVRSVRSVLDELLGVNGLGGKTDRQDRCLELMEIVGLPAAVLDTRPLELSGGQRQRIGLARALALEPRVIVADEPTAALDVSVQASVLNLLSELRARLGLSMLFISHNLAVLRHLCDEVAIMYLGRVVEQGATERVFRDPQHPYTRALVASVPEVGEPAREAVLTGEPPSPFDLPVGCPFHPRCPEAIDSCRTTRPELTLVDERFVACLRRG